MKKVLLLTAAIACTVITVSAQISKGSSYLGGGINYTTNNNKTTNSISQSESKSNSLNIYPSIGFAYKENHVWGLFLSYGHNESSPTQLKGNSYGLGAFLRQYKPIGKGFYIFAQEALGGTYSSSDQWSGMLTNTKAISVNLGISPGFACDVSKKFQLEVSLNNLAYAGYSHSTTKPKDVASDYKATTSSFNIGSSLSSIANVGALTIGARYLFGR